MGSLCALEHEALQYPIARRDESVIDNYHGVVVPDPYRWYHFKIGVLPTFCFFGSWCINIVETSYCRVCFIYCRLEDPDSEEVVEFVQKQVDLTETVLKKCETREKLRDNLTKLFDYPRYDVPFRRGDKYFYFHNSGLQPQRVLYLQVCFLIVSVLVVDLVF